MLLIPSVAKQSWLSELSTYEQLLSGTKPNCLFSLRAHLHKSLRIFRVAEVACLHERRSCESLFYIPLNERGKVTINSLKLDL